MLRVSSGLGFSGFPDRMAFLKLAPCSVLKIAVQALVDPWTLSKLGCVTQTALLGLGYRVAGRELSQGDGHTENYKVSLK